MRVLLTGASGFLGSHVLDCLRARNIPAVVLLRSSSPRRFLEAHLKQLEVRGGSISDPESLQRAMSGITHVIHCAGLTKARHVREFYEVNHTGTSNVVDAIITAGKSVRRLVHISSLAAAGPGTSDQPVRDTDTPHPVSEYGKSKLAGEEEVCSRSPSEFVILRPPAVYGPRDSAFLPLFKAVRNHLLPLPSNTQALSLVFVKDLAEAIVTCLDAPAVVGKRYFVAQKEIITARSIAEEIARQASSWTWRCPLPYWVLWLVCLVNEAKARLTGKAEILNLQKLPELRAPGWVCDSSRFASELGMDCQTNLTQGIKQTLAWYRQNSWL